MFITPENWTYERLKNDIEKGLLKIPQFQRDFVWSKEQSARLIDSILKNYPINSFIIWETKENLKYLRNIGNIDFPVTQEDHFTSYVLDGQQRITSIYAALNGVKITRQDDKKEEDFSTIYIDLDSNEEDIVILDISTKEPFSYISLNELMECDLVYIAQNYTPERIKKIQKYRDAINNYPFSSIKLTQTNIEEATEIFTRLNVGGKKLSVFEIMVAKTFDKDCDFDLAEKYENLIEILKNANYDTIPNSTLLQSISVCLTNDCTKKTILNLNKQEFISIYDKVESALLDTIDYFKTKYRIPVSALLPYDGLVVPFTYFFYKTKGLKPTATQAKYLEDYFWRVVISSRFYSSLEQRIGQDINRINLILNEQQPVYDEIIDITPERIKHEGEFTTSKGYIKGLLCLLAYYQPKSFKDNSIVLIDNSWLKQANSKNYHHFFPKAYMKKYRPDIPYSMVNHIANITIVDGYINKQEIRDKAPSKYMQKYISENEHISETMASHLIEIKQSNLINDDFETFFNNRIELISQKLQERIILTANDRCKSEKL